MDVGQKFRVVPQGLFEATGKELGQVAREKQSVNLPYYSVYSAFSTRGFYVICQCLLIWETLSSQE